MNRARRAAALVPLLLAACGTTAVQEERTSAEREDVCAALYRQLDEVLARRDSIAGEDDSAARERDDLARLADDIAVRIVRLDPEADVEAIVKRLERPH